jgi:hypothetical protein
MILNQKQIETGIRRRRKVADSDDNRMSDGRLEETRGG